MIARGLRLLLFRFLPRRVAPILMAWEAFQLFRRFRRGRRPTPVTPRRIRTVGDEEVASDGTKRGRGSGRDRFVA